MTSSFWQDKSVLVTGHTGFKGSWLCLWLNLLGAKVYGFSLNPSTSPNLFAVARVSEVLIQDQRGDIRNLEAIRNAITLVQPEIIFHLAAQPLVRYSYQYPLDTFSINVTGTVNLLEAVRQCPSVQTIIVVTTDKVYANRNWIYPYRETDALGGQDPYSASKAMVEILVNSYRSSFFNTENSPKLFTVRAGNVIGGGDWSADRLIPDCFRALTQGTPIDLRYPQAIRPWQHVLEPLYGYLLLTEKSYKWHDNSYLGAWNFGLLVGQEKTVQELVEKLFQLWQKSTIINVTQNTHLYESEVLRLDSSQAICKLGWHPCWSVEEALEATVIWYKTWLEGQDMQEFTSQQIDTYQSMLA
ncbi:CDP-glucose 4,6-dehydratase [Gloeomargarita lithophora Alchichica-D10]|uniref:CDP-glucose 4,6-dehydratase n=1 Tax=Gloeomargarita lithophora Alchichica-D10 TaxID=1188229 RepID=A0A1J0AB69_9CYAN|nr:CDP-glucose 4,6-dehydratase [Gloeomargarita lithophora]APB33174.1 CDP-glucose 4,6-dehydratase [Gloeomargarita lithophora Alchichica-D10]